MCVEGEDHRLLEPSWLETIDIEDMTRVGPKQNHETHLSSAIAFSESVNSVQLRQKMGELGCKASGIQPPQKLLGLQVLEQL